RRRHTRSKRDWSSDVCSSDLAVVGLWLNFSVRPSLKRELEQFFAEQGEQASNRIAERVETAVKRGVVEGVKSLSTRDVLQDTTRNLAKTSAEIDRKSVV